MGRVGAGQGSSGEPRDGEAAPAPAHGVRAAVQALWVEAWSYDRRALVICLYVPVALTLLEYMFHPSRARYWMPLTQYLTWAVMPFLWYFSGCLLLMVALPMVLLRTLGVRPRAMGVRLRGTAGAAPMYGVLYLLAFPTLVWAATQPAFVLTYPFFRPPGAPWTWDYLLFELMYCLQFFAVEYFFRGVLTLGLKPTLGRSSVLIMLTPYCMLHFHKPLPEALGAIGAGWLLGTLAWRTETVIWGWCLHYGVAFTMNMLGLMAR